MNTLKKFAAGLSILVVAFNAAAQGNDLSLNGAAAFEQLRKEYYIGGLYLGWPGHDPAAIVNMPGKKRMLINVTADRWPALRFAQMWNQAITINNPSAQINANAMDILAFTSIPKGDLVEGDQISVELTGGNITQVSVNGILALRTNSPALFTMLLNAWIGQRPPSTEFKRDILDLPKDQAGKDLIARLENTHPNEARKKAIVAWGFKPEPEPTAAPAVAAVTAAAPAAATKAAEAAAKPAPEVKPTAEPKPAPAPVPAPAPAPVATAKPAEPKPAPAQVAKAEPPPAAAPAPQPEPAPTAKATNTAEQDNLESEYFAVVRKQVLRNIDYPRRAIKDNIEGMVMVRLKVDNSGSLSSFEIAQSADDLLDAEAERAVKKAAPFPKAPEGLSSNIHEFVVPIVFKLSQ